METLKQTPSAIVDDNAEFDQVDAYVGGRARERRLHLDKSADEVAASVNLTPEQLEAFEGGTGCLSPQVLRALARALGVRIHYFFDRDPLPEVFH